MLRILFLMLVLACSARSIAQEKKETTASAVAESKIDYKQIGAPMPRILLVTLDSMQAKNKKKLWQNKKNIVPAEPKMAKKITETDLDTAGNVFVMMFNPTCGHCEDMAAQLTRNYELFKKTHVVFMANPVMRAYLPDFRKLFKINEYPLMEIGIDSAGFINSTFLYQQLPQINIYSAGRDRKLLKTYTGSTPIDTLAQYIN